jgi:hypothetical protein
MSPVRYGLGFISPEDNIFHTHRRKSLKFLDTFSALVILTRTRTPVRHVSCIQERSVMKEKQSRVFLELRQNT